MAGGERGVARRNFTERRMKLYMGAFVIIMTALIAFTLSSMASMCCSDVSNVLHVFDMAILYILVGVGVIMGVLLKGGA